MTGVQTVLSFIRRLKEDHIACIFVTHNLHDVYAVADRFLVMVRGTVAASVRRDEVTVEDLVELQLAGKADSRELPRDTRAAQRVAPGPHADR